MYLSKYVVRAHKIFWDILNEIEYQQKGKKGVLIYFIYSIKNYYFSWIIYDVTGPTTG